MGVINLSMTTEHEVRKTIHRAINQYFNETAPKDRTINGEAHHVFKALRDNGRIRQLPSDKDTAHPRPTRAQAMTAVRNLESWAVIYGTSGNVDDSWCVDKARADLIAIIKALTEGFKS